jgi:2-hydroxychromene-2-carboxylate isomerase
MTTPQIDFFYFFGSGYAYLSVIRIEKLAKEAGVTVRWRPFSVRTLMSENNIALRDQPGKMRYIWRDVERRAKLHGLAFLKPPIWPTDPDQLANRVGIVAAQQGWCPAYSVASFRSWYLDGRPLGDVEGLSDIVTRLGRSAREVIDLADTAAVRSCFDAETNAARTLGIFGSPSFVADGEVFWGDDRLEEALAWALGRHPMQLAAQSVA